MFKLVQCVTLGGCLEQADNMCVYSVNEKPLIGVSVVILNYNGSKFLRNLFESLSNQTFRDFEVVFVDNKSTDNSLQLLRKILSDRSLRHLSVKIIRNAINLGYSKGNNIGLEYTDGKYIVFLNNDTYVSQIWLEKLVKVMDIHPTIGACQSRLIQEQTGEVQTDGWLLDVFGMTQGAVFCRNSLQTVSKIPFYVSGASMIVRASALKKIDGFDPELFYGDFDLCWRLRLLGYDMAVALHSVCYHFGGVATKMLVSPVKAIYNHDCEVLRVLLKNYSMRNIVKRVPLSVIVMLIEATYFSLKYRNPLYIVAFLQALKWNLRKFGNTLVARSKIQNNRKVSDHEIENRMTDYSALLKRNGTVEIA